MLAGTQVSRDINHARQPRKTGLNSGTSPPPPAFPTCPFGEPGSRAAWPLAGGTGRTALRIVTEPCLSFRFSISSRSWTISGSESKAVTARGVQTRANRAREGCVHSFIVHCVSPTQYKTSRALCPWQPLHVSAGLRTAAALTTGPRGRRAAAHRVQNKDLFFKQVTLVYFIHYTFFLQKKIKLYNCINIKFFHHENG